MASKIVVIGPINGQLRSSFKKLSTVHTKTNFSLAIISGDLFSDNHEDEELSELLEGKIVIPISTYFTVGNRVLPPRVIEKLSKNEDICDNLHYLEKRSITKTSDGIRIVTLGGALDESILAGQSNEQFLPFHTVGDAKLLHGANTADILLTTSWPAAIRTGSKVPKSESLEDPPSYEHISELCKVLKPRYHISSSDFFYEREPYFHPTTGDTPDRYLTRFISLAAHGNPPKQKALYAFNLPKSADFTLPLPPGTTALPFVASKFPKKRQALDPAPYSRYSNGDNERSYKRGRREKQPRPGLESCYFCIANENSEKHLIVAIGEESYLTVAKGPLTTAETNLDSNVEFPAHALIIPFVHETTLALNPDPDSRAKTFSEMQAFKKSLQNMIAIRSANKLGAVTYEISRASGFHTHWQFLPMPIELFQQGLAQVVEAAFQVEAENFKYPKLEVRDVGLGENEGDFFRVWVWTPPADDDESNEGTTKCLLLPLDDNARFDMQFGRRVLAKLLGLEKRLQWKDCSQTEDEEKTEVELFKQAFKAFDFTT